MSQYLLLLGNTPELSYLEASSILDGSELERFSDHLAETSLPSDPMASQLMYVLGGTFKILKKLFPLESKPADAYRQIKAYLSKQTDKPTFALTGMGSLSEVFYPQKLKNLLKKDGISSRYREGDQWGASAAILRHEQDVIDLIVVESQGQRYLARTVASQHVDEWTARDRDKPYAAGRKGMLPPKLARMMVNIGLGRLQRTEKDQPPVLYDPFCGTGTILIEALIRGCEVIGSDLDHEAVAGTLENLYWLEEKYDQSFKYQVFQTDAAHADKRDWQTKVDLIVTEPFLGKPDPKPEEMGNIFKGLTSLYLGAFKTWMNFLRPGGLVVIVFPFAQGEGKRFDLEGLIDKLQKYRYTLEVNPVEYFREKAVIKREIRVFRYQGQKAED